jgi:hypothetical protein
MEQAGDGDDVARGRAAVSLLQQAALGTFEQILTMSHGSSAPGTQTLV